jgi:hypothetical protein
LQGLGIALGAWIGKTGRTGIAQRMMGVGAGGWAIDRRDDNGKVDIFLPGMNDWHGTVVSKSRLTRYWTRSFEVLVGRKRDVRRREKERNAAGQAVII